jgi:chaperonin GroES
MKGEATKVKIPVASRNNHLDIENYVLSSRLESMIKPIGDRVVIEVAEVELKTKSGIIMPETSKEKPQKGKVVAVGTGKVLDNGTRLAPEVKVGDEILFNKYAGSEVKVDDKEYLVIRESDILAIL